MVSVRAFIADNLGGQSRTETFSGRRLRAHHSPGPASSVRDARDAEAQPANDRRGEIDVWVAVMHRSDDTESAPPAEPSGGRESARQLRQTRQIEVDVGGIGKRPPLAGGNEAGRHAVRR